MARSGCIFGGSGSFKTTAVAHFAHWIFQTTGKGTLLLSTDGGGWEPCQEEVNSGMIRAFRLDAEVAPLGVIRKISQGYWPKDETRPLSMENCLVPVSWDEIGGIAVEGITSLGTMLMRHCADKDLKTGESGTSPVLQNVVVDGNVITERFTQNSRGHFGFVQNQLYSLLMNFQSLPIAYFLTTAHEKRYTEDGELQVGIATPGKAITPLVPSWVGDCIHAQDYRTIEKVKIKNEKGESVDEDTVRIRCRYYFTKHVDPATNAVFDCKPRVTHSKALELEKRFPGGFFVPTPEHGFDHYLNVVDELAKDAAQSDSMKNWRARMDAKRMGKVATVSK